MADQGNTPERRVPLTPNVNLRMQDDDEGLGRLTLVGEIFTTEFVAKEIADLLEVHLTINEPR